MVNVRPSAVGALLLENDRARRYLTCDAHVVPVPGGDGERWKPHTVVTWAAHSGALGNPFQWALALGAAGWCLLAHAFLPSWATGRSGRTGRRAGLRGWCTARSGCRRPALPGWRRSRSAPLSRPCPGHAQHLPQRGLDVPLGVLLKLLCLRAKLGGTLRLHGFRVDSRVHVFQ